MFYCSDRLLQLTVSLPQHRQQIHFAQMQFEGLKLSHLQQLLVYSDWELIKEKRNQYGYIQSKMYRFFLSLIVAPCHLLLFLLSYSCSRIQIFESPSEKQIGLNYQVWKLRTGGKITVFDWWREIRFGLNYQEFRKNRMVWEIGSKRAFSRDTCKIIATNATLTNVKLPDIIDLSPEILPKMRFVYLPTFSEI